MTASVLKREVREIGEEFFFLFASRFSLFTSHFSPPGAAGHPSEARPARF
jgi:hypothetical protein